MSLAATAREHCRCSCFRLDGSRSRGLVALRVELLLVDCLLWHELARRRLVLSARVVSHGFCREHFLHVPSLNYF